MRRALLAIAGFVGLVGICATSTRAEAQQANANLRLLVLTKIQTVGAAPTVRGLDIDTFNTVLNFALSAHPEIQVATTPTSLPQMDKAKVMTLAGIIHGTNEIAFWNGDLTLIDGRTVRLGPITLGDAKGLRMDAPRLIAELVLRNVRDEYASRAPPAIRIGCFRGDNDQANVLAVDFRASLSRELQQSDTPVRSPPVESPCEISFSDRSQDETLVTTAVVTTTNTKAEASTKSGLNYSLTPSLTDATYQDLPLPSFRGSEAAYVQQRTDYAALVLRAILAYRGRNCSVMTLLGASQVRGQTTEKRLEAGRRILQQKDCPFLAAALLENSQSDTADVILDIARGYRQAGEGAAAFRLLKKASVDFPGPGETRAEIQYELALAAFDQQRFREAMESFASALREKEFPSAHYPFAQAAYLSDERALASEQIVQALRFNATDPDTLMLGSRIALDRASPRDTTPADMQYFKEALDYAKAAYNETGADKKVPIQDFARQLIAKLISAAPLTVGHLSIAEEATTALLPSDPTTLLQRARIRLVLAQLGHARAQMEADAIEDLRAAGESAKIRQPPDPQFAVIDLELAEAYLITGRFGDAARIAGAFLDAKRDPDSPEASYEPVALLLKFSGDTLAARSENRSVLEDLRKKIESYKRWPTLMTRVSAQGTQAAIPIAEWDFSAVDRFLCSRKDPAAETVLKLSTALQQALSKATSHPLRDATCGVGEGPRSSSSK